MEKVTFLADKNHRSLVFRSLALIRIARSLLSRVSHTLFLPSIFSSLRLFHFECEKYAIDAETPCNFACEISHDLSQLLHCESNGPFDRKKRSEKRRLSAIPFVSSRAFTTHRGAFRSIFTRSLLFTIIYL